MALLYDLMDLTFILLDRDVMATLVYKNESRSRIPIIQSHQLILNVAWTLFIEIDQYVNKNLIKKNISLLCYHYRN